MNLIKFDETKSNHKNALQYFAYDSGHADYLINGEISDFDFAFREFVFDKFNLVQAFIEEPNGCSHEMLSRNLDKARFNIYYGFDTENNDGDVIYNEIAFSFDGVLHYNTDTERVVLEPMIDTIIMAQ